MHDEHRIDTLDALRAVYRQPSELTRNKERPGGMWDPAVWAELADTPDGAAILSCQQVVEVDAATTRQWLDKGYEKQLAEEA